MFFRQGDYSTKKNFTIASRISEKKEKAMDGNQMKKTESGMRKENAISVVKKLLSGFCVILMVGICAYAFLLILMLAI